ncbi:MAG TPA: FAD-dependent oxidoreductase [Polyangia bacterium]|nr:FAD-dependent oxidoreductase [Polyangia bacterium]
MAARKIVIVGAGAAGVFTAYRVQQMYGDQYDIVIMEASDRVGGNTSSSTVNYGGNAYNIDTGAQFFYKNPQPNYNFLLQQLGFEEPLPQGVVYSVPAGFTVWDKPSNARRFWMPSFVSGFGKYSLADWDRIVEFGLFLGYSAFLDGDGADDWGLSVEDWLGSMTLVSDDFKENVIKPFLYQFVSLPLPRIGEASAKYAITYLARNLSDPSPSNIAGLAGAPQPVFVTYQSTIGLDGILKRVLELSKATLQLSTPVQCIARQGSKPVVIAKTGAIVECSDVVLACDPHTAADMLTAGGTCDPQLIQVLLKMEYAPLPIMMQKDGACWMPGDQNYWEPINTLVDGTGVTFSAWFGPMRSTYDGGKQIPVFKSWGAPAVANCPQQWQMVPHNVMMPTTTFVGLRDQLQCWQGREGVFFAGGWTQWFDSQEAALNSATAVAEMLPGLRAALAVPRTITISPDQYRYNLVQWLAMIARYAPPSHQVKLATALENVAFNG